MPNTKRSPRVRWTLMIWLALATFFLFSEHRAHVLTLLSYLLAFSCVLMHLFHHHGHVHGGSKGQPGDGWRGSREGT